MTLDSEVEIIDVDSKNELLRYWSGISKLFSESFGKALSRELWDWAYQLNPNGEPLVSLAMYNGAVVGHYAVIPLNLISDKKRLNGYLSMTTMVAPEFRRLKLFRKLAERVYSRIQFKGNPAVVFGFPNDNSAPGFVKRLGWSILEEYSVVSVRPDQLFLAKEILESKLSKDSYKLDLSSDEIKKWRTHKPNQSWLIKHGIGIKESEQGNDLMFIEDPEGLKSIADCVNINMILPVGKDRRFEVAFPYMFGYRVFNMDMNPRFFVEMSMSDIF